MIGGVMTNPDTHDAPFLILKFRDYNNVPVVYPPMDKVGVNYHKRGKICWAKLSRF